MARAASGNANKAMVRDDWVPKSAYLDPEFARLESERLWTRVWQVACREEELPRPGNFVTVDIANESFLVVRSEDNAIRAFHNVCTHRGRKLVEAVSGRAPKFVCGFHAWMFDSNGECVHIPDEQDWQGAIKACDMALRPLKVDTWVALSSSTLISMQSR